MSSFHSTSTHNLPPSDPESTDSDGDENICRSPTKSPLKLSSVLKRKRLSLEDSSDDTVSPSSSGVDLKEPTDSNFKFQKPELRKKKFSFYSCGSEDRDSSSVSVIIPEQLAASYGLYVWPASPVLAWYLWLWRWEE